MENAVLVVGRDAHIASVLYLTSKNINDILKQNVQHMETEFDPSIIYGYGARKGYTSVFTGTVGHILQNREKEYYRRPPGVRVIIDTGKSIILQKEKREELGSRWDYRLCGGKAFDSLTDFLTHYKEVITDNDQQKLKEAMVEEMKQEIGIHIASWKELEEYYISQSSSSVEHDLYYFIFRGTHFKVCNSTPEKGEVIEKVELLYKEVFTLLMNKAFSEDRTRAVLFQFLLEEKKEFIFHEETHY